MHPDLRPLFGSLSTERNDALLGRFRAVDARLVTLAELASAHVGVSYRACGLDLILSGDGSSSGIHGGPTGDAGDIWFDVSPAAPPWSAGQRVESQWTVASIVVVFCCDSPEPRGDSNIHELLRLEETADAPERVLDILESHVTTIEAEIPRIARERFTMTPHDQLP